MNQPARTMAMSIKRKLTLLAIAIASLALTGIVAGPALQAAGLKEAPGQQKRTFTISGDFATELSPGVSTPLNLTFDNPNQQALQIDKLLVSVGSTSSAACHPNNFATTAYSGTYPITIPTGTSTLSDAASDSSKWPRAAMVNKPTVNQNACKGVRLGLSYSATASK